jgi:hypothetical protein
MNASISDVVKGIQNRQARKNERIGNHVVAMVDGVKSGVKKALDWEAQKNLRRAQQVQTMVDKVKTADQMVGNRLGAA